MDGKMVCLIFTMCLFFVLMCSDMQILTSVLRLLVGFSEITYPAGLYFRWCCGLSHWGLWVFTEEVSLWKHYLTTHFSECIPVVMCHLTDFQNTHHRPLHSEVSGFLFNSTPSLFCFSSSFLFTSPFPFLFQIKNGSGICQQTDIREESGDKEN